jgi:hypothetical protein
MRKLRCLTLDAQEALTATRPHHLLLTNLLPGCYLLTDLHAKLKPLLCSSRAPAFGKGMAAAPPPGERWGSRRGEGRGGAGSERWGRGGRIRMEKGSRWGREWRKIRGEKGGWCRRGASPAYRTDVYMLAEH